VPDALAPPFRVFVSALNRAEWSHCIEIGEIHAILEPERVIRFAELLGREPLIERALPERLDLVLVHAPAMDLPMVASVATQAWATAGRPLR
jgi:hypothetical protein